MRNLIPQHLFEMSKYNDYNIIEDWADFLFYVKYNTHSDIRNLRKILDKKFDTHGQILILPRQKDFDNDSTIELDIERSKDFYSIHKNYPLTIFNYDVNRNTRMSVEMSVLSDYGIVLNIFINDGITNISNKYNRVYPFSMFSNLDKFWNEIYQKCIDVISIE
jgi:hypothetical protein